MHAKVPRKSGSAVGPITPPNSNYLKGAEGWLELGNLAESHAELGKIESRYKSHPEVLKLRYQLVKKLQDWGACLELADLITKVVPRDIEGYLMQAEALENLDRAREALQTLSKVSTEFPRDWRIHYHIARFWAQLGGITKAKSYLDHAVELGGKEAKEMIQKEKKLDLVWTGKV